MKTIYKKQFHLLDNEFIQIPHNEYFNLKILKELGHKERIIGLLNDINFTQKIDNLICINVNHGAYIPINCGSSFKNISIINDITTENINNQNIFKNIKLHNCYNIEFFELNEYNLDKFKINDKNILFFENSFGNIIQNKDMNIENTYLHKYFEVLHKNLYTIFSFILINNKNEYIHFFENNRYHSYTLTNSDLRLFISDEYFKQFNETYNFFINKHMNDFFYDNLINLCIMVKNGGPQFESMLKENIHLIDNWTILDTGSTDNTINFINELLVGKKRGKLYQESFINFRDSRNRLLELAGNICKYTLMLDDTYIVKGNLREFLNTVRGDQFSDSFTLYIKSDDVEYGSNRILISDRNLRYLYKIHEVITPDNNNNVIIPMNVSYIFDGRFDYMEERTIQRKQLDLKLLQEEIDEDPENPRSYYYMAQTYNILEEYELAYEYFIKRMLCKKDGFIQEKIDAIFEAARIANFKLDKPWKECEELYLKSYELDKSRPDSLYFLGIHEYLEGSKKMAFEYFKKAFHIGYPIHCQYSLKPTLSYHFLPRYLTHLCYEFNDYELGEQSSLLFLQNNSSNSEYYDIILSWYRIFVNINKLFKEQNYIFDKIYLRNVEKKPYFVFVADGGFNKWSGSSILSQGVGGSETYIIEMARHIQKYNIFKVIVFCNCESEEVFENVEYVQLFKYQNFIKQNYIHSCVISRYTEYYPVSLLCNIDNIYLIAHDLTFTGSVIPMNFKLKQIFCLSEWHCEYLSAIFPTLKNIIIPLYYGIDLDFFKNSALNKQKNKFIYSSFPNRGLLELLQMWPKINDKYNDATLHIYSDINGTWVNNVEKDKMKMIRDLLESYEDKYNIYYYGWVDKNTLYKAWMTSEYWFYPCTFMETFCLTALEAAASKTAVITNNLAALKNTVNNRGIIIDGNSTTEEWKNRALIELFKIMENRNKKEKLIDKNYNWACRLSWENQAKKFLEQYIFKNILQYCGMFNWTNELPTKNDKDLFENFIKYFNQNNRKLKPKVLEIGTYSGTSLINIINRIPNSLGYGVDKWQSYNEFNLGILNNIIHNNIENKFDWNVNICGLQNRIFKIQNDSTETLIDFIQKGETFDFIYIDGSHKCLDAYSDCVLSFKILDKGGLMVIDDYLYNKDEIYNNSLEIPYYGVNYFLEKYEKQIKIYDKGYRVFIEKI